MSAPLHQFSPVRVLVVDDFPDMTDTLTELLSISGFHVMSAVTGQEALQLAESERLSVVVSDVRMPGMDGYELARRLRALPGPRLTLVAVTTCATEADRLRLIDGGFDHVLAKPAEPAELIALVRSASYGSNGVGEASQHTATE